MKKMGKGLLLVFMFSVMLAFTACAGEEYDAKIVASVDGEKLTELDMLAAYTMQNHLNDFDMSSLSLDEQVDIVKGLIESEIIYKEAQKSGYLEKEEIKGYLDLNPEYVTIREYFDKEIAAKANPTQEEISGFYEDKKDMFMVPGKINISQIVVDNKEKADELYNRLKNGEDFRDLVQKYSIDDLSKKNKGKAGYTNKKGFVSAFGRNQEVADKLYQLDEGDYLEPVEFTSKSRTKGKTHYYIFRVDEIIEPYPKPLDQVKHIIIRNLNNMKNKIELNKLVENMKEKYPVEVYYEVAWDTLETQPKEALAEIPKLNFVIDNDYFEYKLHQIPRNYRESFRSGERKKDYINIIIKDRLVFQKAKEDGYLDDPLIKAKIKQKNREYVFNNYFDEIIKEELNPTEKEIDSLYQKNYVSRKIEKPLDEVKDQIIEFYQSVNAKKFINQYKKDILNKYAVENFILQEINSRTPEENLAAAEEFLSKKHYSRALLYFNKVLNGGDEVDPQLKYKAQFMIGYIYHEYLKIPEKAKEAFKKVLEYPTGELHESAKFMIESIENPDKYDSVINSIKEEAEKNESSDEKTE